jgi:hypothetical protein
VRLENYVSLLLLIFFYTSHCCAQYYNDHLYRLHNNTLSGQQLFFDKRRSTVIAWYLYNINYNVRKVISTCIVLAVKTERAPTSSDRVNEPSTYRLHRFNRGFETVSSCDLLKTTDFFPSFVYDWCIEAVKVPFSKSISAWGLYYIFVLNKYYETFL